MVTQIVDMQHYEPARDPAAGVPAPARRLAEYYGSIVEAATASWLSGVVILSAVRCRRRPGHRPCPGHIAFRRSDIPARIDWTCSQCSDNGIISGWRYGPWDLSRTQVKGALDRNKAWVEAQVEEDAYRLLLEPALRDRSVERVLRSARSFEGAVVLEAPRAAMESLLEVVSAESNHTPSRRARLLLDQAYDDLEGALQSSP